MPGSNGHTWKECDDRAELFVEQLAKEGFTGQDIVMMAGQIMKGGIYLLHFEAEAAAREAMKGK